MKLNYGYLYIEIRNKFSSIYLFIFPKRTSCYICYQLSTKQLFIELSIFSSEKKLIRNREILRRDKVSMDSASWKHVFLCGFYLCIFLTLAPTSMFTPWSNNPNVLSFPRRWRRLREAFVLEDEEVVSIWPSHEAGPSSWIKSQPSEQQRRHDRSAWHFESFQCRCMPV